MKTGLLEQLMEYGESDYYPFHMPGHKREPLEFPNPYAVDITEIEGFDNLHNPQGILKSSMEYASEIYGSGESWYLVNGSTAGILSAVCGLTERGGSIIMGRNCHRSAYHGVFLNELNVEYIYPQLIPEWGIQGGISPEDVEKAIRNCPKAQAVLLVSPTYEGIVSDIKEIAGICHKAGIPLIVDEAHGAHFPFAYQGGFPVSALEMGADVVIQSLHKTLPSFTQTAILHFRKGFGRMEEVKRYLPIFQTSSPSYLFLASMDRCIRIMEEDQGNRLKELALWLKEIRDLSMELACLEILPSDWKGQYGIYDMDPSKLVISGRKAGVSGKWLADRLRRNSHLEMEMAGTDYILAMTSPFDRKEGLERLWKALKALDQEAASLGLWKNIRQNKKDTCSKTEIYLGSQRMKGKAALTIYEGRRRKTEEAPLKEAIGRISGEFVFVYPPGIPILAPGEEITREIVNQIEEYKRKHLPVEGTPDSSAEYLKVLIGESENNG